ncbi:MarR family transcriptional regulator [Streptomyces sp. NPDC002004]
MDANRSASDRHQDESVEAARELIELLEVLWERGRDMASTPVSASQLRVLYSLDREEGINLRTLGELLGAAPPSVSRLCDRIEALGFIRRETSPVSRRELELHLTSSGRAFLEELRSRREAALWDVISRMKPSARKALLTGLTGFQDALHESESGPRPGRSVTDARSA